MGKELRIIVKRAIFIACIIYLFYSGLAMKAYLFIEDIVLIVLPDSMDAGHKDLIVFCVMLVCVVPFLLSARKILYEKTNKEDK